jgi:hypothetical protein
MVVPGCPPLTTYRSPGERSSRPVRESLAANPPYLSADMSARRGLAVLALLAAVTSLTMMPPLVATTALLDRYLLDRTLIWVQSIPTLSISASLAGCGILVGLVAVASARDQDQ